jgi:hypothetical protein
VRRLPAQDTAAATALPVRCMNHWSAWAPRTWMIPRARRRQTVTLLALRAVGVICRARGLVVQAVLPAKALGS